jgi:zinc transport system permease protein
MSFLDSWELIGDSVIAAVICAVLSAYIGVYVLIRRVIFVSAAIAQASGLGIALSFFVGSFIGGEAIAAEGSMIPQAFAIAAALACALSFSRASGGGRLASETQVGLVWVIAGAVLHLILSSSRVVQEAHEIDALLYGSAVLISREQLLVLGGVAAVTMAIHLAVRKELTFVSLDPEMARTLGYRVPLWDALLFATLAVAISFVVRSLGALPAFAFLVIPGAVAQLVASRVGALFPIAVVAGLAAAVGGFAWSFEQDLPTGPTLVAAAGMLLIPALLFRAVRGRK